MSFPRFVSAGTVNTGLTYLLYLALLQVAPYWVAYSSAFAAGIGLAYVLNRVWVFRQHRGAASVMLLPLVYGAQYLFGLMVVAAWVSLLGWDERLAPLAAIALSLPLTYLMSRYAFAANANLPNWVVQLPRLWRTALLAAVLTLVACILTITLPRTTLFVELEGSPTSVGLGYDGKYEQLDPTSLQLGTHYARGVRIPNLEHTAFTLVLDKFTRMGSHGVVRLEQSLVHTHVTAYRGATVPPTELDQNSALAIDMKRSTPQVQTHYRLDAVFLFFLLWAVLEAARGYKRLPWSMARWLALASALAIIVIAFKAYTLPFNHGPDEQMHVGSLYWYFENLRPPLLALGDTPYRDIIWSTSYVLGATSDFSYLLNARAAALLGWMLPNLADYQQLRLSQLLLILIAGGLCARLGGAPYGWSYLAAWLLLPQLAYTATYANGDVLSFAMAMLACTLLLSGVSNSANNRWRLAKLLSAGFLLVNAKSNYLPLLAVLGVWFLLQNGRWRPTFKQLAVALLAMPFIFYRRIFNLWDVNQTGHSYLEHSYFQLKSLFERDKAHPRNLEFESALAFFQNDVPFRYVESVYARMLQGMASWDWSVALDPSWYRALLHSLFGVFGYMNAFVPWWLLVLPAVGLMAVAYEASRHPAAHRWMLAATAVLTLAATLFYSISQGPQPQGRYLFPVVALAFALLAHRTDPRAKALQTRRLPMAALPTMAALLMFSPP